MFRFPPKKIKKNEQKVAYINYYCKLCIMKTLIKVFIAIILGCIALLTVLFTVGLVSMASQ